MVGTAGSVVLGVAAAEVFVVPGVGVAEEGVVLAEARTDGVASAVSDGPWLP